jgi:allophanate hydrolase subunit 1
MESSDWIGLANSFATIMQLVCNFRQERSESKKTELAELMAWIEYHKFEGIKSAIQGNANLQLEIQELLKRDVAEVREKIGIINDAVATVASRLDGFSGMVTA